MPAHSYETLFPQPILDDIFSARRADQFFEALLGDASDGAFDIVLTYAGEADDELHFEFQLRQRPGRCLACNLTYGLPEVFLRHPVIDVAGVVKQLDSRMLDGKRCAEWTLGRTREVSRSLHVLPLTVKLTNAEPIDAA